MSSIFPKGAALAVLAMVAGLTSAQAAGSIGWVLGNEPNATSAYTPASANSYNSAGGSITVTPVSAGVYTVSFAGLHTRTGSDDVQVTAYQTAGYCTAGAWSYVHATVNATVNCYSASGIRVNTYFDLLYQERAGIFGTGTKGIAFVYANSPTTANYTPTSATQYNSTGGTNTVIRIGAGSYVVNIPGLSNQHGDVQVTAVGPNASSPARCKVESWQSGANNGTNIYVLCFNSSGAAADELFDVAYAVLEPFGLGVASATPGAWAWAELAKSTTPYDTKAAYQFNGFATGKLTAQNQGTGVYNVNVPDYPSYSSSIALVTAYGSDNSYCNPNGWLPISVTCYAQGGRQKDDIFDAAYQTSKN
jgi:hypothetical protein